jgi:hypothetical protein
MKQIYYDKQISHFKKSEKMQHANKDKHTGMTWKRLPTQWMQKNSFKNEGNKRLKREKGLTEMVEIGWIGQGLTKANTWLPVMTRKPAKMDLELGMNKFEQAGS